MGQLKLTRHFQQRWMERVGNWPTVAAVTHFIRHSVRVQRGEDLLRCDGRPFRLLAIYWHPELDLVIKVDAQKQTAVTVLSRENWSRRYGDMNIYFRDARTAPRSATAGRIARIKAMFGRTTA